MESIDLKDITLLEGFWKNRTELLVHHIIPYQWDTLNNRTEGVPLSHSVENFRIAAGESEGEPEGTIFQDSDVAKWIEAAAYSLNYKPDPELEKIIDELVRLIGRSQHDNGYVNTFFTAKGIEQRWTDLVMGHEMYCAGHLIEAAVAYFKATGKKEFVGIMSRYADLIAEEFGPGENQIHSYDGHPEIELALYRLAEATGKDKYSKLADYFMNIRGSVKNYYKGVAAKEGMIPKSRWFESDYYLAHKPVREMREVTGHAVRAVYLYSGLADQYRATGDPELLETLKALWANLEEKRVYITGGIGSQAHGERFTIDFDIPPSTGYTESCASIGLIFWAKRMFLIEPDGKYADMIERALYNGVLSGIALDGKSYLYVNPLEVKPKTAQYRHDLEHVETHRQGWFECSCCPTNIARMIGSVGEYIYSREGKDIYVHQFISSESQFENIKLVQQTNFPWSGSVSLSVDMDSEEEFSINLRIPSWCGSYAILVNGKEVPGYTVQKGYARLKGNWKSGDRIELELTMAVQFIEADSRVADLAGKLALSYGPMIYCFEETDNGSELQELIVHTESSIELVQSDLEPAPSIHLLIDGYREKDRVGPLYHSYEKNKTQEKIRLRAIPYFQWGNREKDREMRVWMRYR